MNSPKHPYAKSIDKRELVRQTKLHIQRKENSTKEKPSVQNKDFPLGMLHYIMN